MVIALRAVHIRGEIHTNVDYTTDLIQDKEYVGNEIHTGWLDSRIARRIKAQRPPWHICVVTGALYVSGNTADYTPMQTGIELVEVSAGKSHF